MANSLNKITTKSILDATVATADIAADAVTGAKIADDAIDSEHITDGAIDNAHIASDAAIAKSKLGSLSISNADIDANAAIAFSKLASLPAQLTGSTNNTITTVTGANAIQGESTLTYDAGALAITGNSAGDGLSITNDGDHYTELSMDADRGSAANALGIIQGKWNNNSVCSIYLQSGADTSNKDDGQIAFNTSAASSSQATRMVVKNNGDVEINDGNLVIGTSGHGIDFSSTAGPTNGSGTSELLDDYEEGTWTPAYGTYGGSSSGTKTYDTNAQNGFYVKVGCVVYAWMDFSLTAWSGGDGTGPTVYGLPFTKNILGSQSYYYSGLTVWSVSDTISGSKSNFSGFVANGDTHLRTYASNTAAQSAVAPMNVTGRISALLIYTTSS